MIFLNTVNDIGIFFFYHSIAACHSKMRKKYAECIFILLLPSRSAYRFIISEFQIVAERFSWP